MKKGSIVLKFVFLQFEVGNHRWSQFQLKWKHSCVKPIKRKVESCCNEVYGFFSACVLWRSHTLFFWMAFYCHVSVNNERHLLKVNWSWQRSRNRMDRLGDLHIFFSPGNMFINQGNSFLAFALSRTSILFYKVTSEIFLAVICERLGYHKIWWNLCWHGYHGFVLFNLMFSLRISESYVLVL